MVEILIEETIRILIHFLCRYCLGRSQSLFFKSVRRTEIAERLNSIYSTKRLDNIRSKKSIYSLLFLSSRYRVYDLAIHSTQYLLSGAIAMSDQLTAIGIFVSFFIRRNRINRAFGSISQTLSGIDIRPIQTISLGCCLGNGAFS